MTSQDSILEGLRQRNIPLQAKSNEEARQTVLDLNTQEEQNPKDGANQKTYGRTSDGKGV